MRCPGLFIAPALLMTTPGCGGDSSSIWELEGTNALMIGEYGDNFVYDGSNIRPGAGSAVVSVDPEAETGTLEATWQGDHTAGEGFFYSGEIRIVIDNWVQLRPWEQGGVAQDLEIHGDTDRGPPVMPKVHAFVAGWGPARVYVNDELVHEVHGHFMYTDGARAPDGVIYSSDRMTPYDPADAGDSWVDPEDREMHVVAHTSDPDPRNYPGDTLWFHLNYEEVAVLRAPADAPR